MCDSKIRWDILFGLGKSLGHYFQTAQTTNFFYHIGARRDSRNTPVKRRKQDLGTEGYQGHPGASGEVVSLLQACTCDRKLVRSPVGPRQSGF